MMRRPGTVARASCVALTPPSTEFSIAIMAPTLRPLDDVVERLADVRDAAPRRALGLGHLAQGLPREGADRAKVQYGGVGRRAHVASLSGGVRARAPELGAPGLTRALPSRTGGHPATAPGGWMGACPAAPEHPPKPPTSST